jgi:hypothetical protein
METMTLPIEVSIERGFPQAILDPFNLPNVLRIRFFE